MRRATLAVTMKLGFGILLALIGSLNAQQLPDARVADVIQAGKVRVGVGLSLVGATKDPTTGELRGLAMDLARALAARLGVELVPVVYPSPPRVLDGVKNGEWDVGVFALDPARRDQVDFSPPYLQVDSTYLVPANSPFRSIIDADQSGIRIAVPRNSVEEIILKRTLKQAELIIETTSAVGFDLLRAGKVSVLAATRPTLLQFSAQLHGSSVLQDRFGVIEIGLAIPKGHGGRLSYISDFIEEAKASGMVQRGIDSAGMRGFQVAPAASSRTQ